VISDGSDKPSGYVSEDGELEVRESIDANGNSVRGYHETALGQYMRWMRSAPDLLEKYETLLRGANREPV
jgi:hypothetical protein